MTATLACGSALMPEVCGARGQQERRQDGDRAQIDERRMREHQALYPFRQRRPIGDVGFEIAAPPIDQVVADVGGAILDRPAHGRLPGALDRLERHAHLRLSASARSSSTA